MYCLKRKATRWGGYVKDGRKKVMAGWCGRHAHELDKAFAGHLISPMGRLYDKKGKWQ